jgi:uncharacterized protein YjbJ (UPF0337 family)
VRGFALFRIAYLLLVAVFCPSATSAQEPALLSGVAAVEAAAQNGRPARGDTDKEQNRISARPDSADESARDQLGANRWSNYWFRGGRALTCRRDDAAAYTMWDNCLSLNLTSGKRVLSHRLNTRMEVSGPGLALNGLDDCSLERSILQGDIKKGHRHTRGIENETKGKMKETEGKVRGDIGEKTGDTSEHIKGRVEEAKGKFQKNFGKGERKA